MSMLMLLALIANSGVSLSTEARLEEAVESHKYTVARWVVEYSGEDSFGSIHRWREVVQVGAGVGELSVIQKANEIFVQRLMSDDTQAHGFMRAIQGGQE